MSWSETDLLTQLPINRGDKVKLLILINKQNRVYSETDIRHNEIEFSGRGMTNIHEIWSPILPPVSGTYDDYGSIEKIKSGVQKDMTHDFFKKSFIFSDPEEYDRVEEWKTKGKTQTLSAYLKGIERGYGCCNNTLNQLTELGAVMIREDVYQEVMKYNPITMHSDWSNKENPIHLYMPWQDSLQSRIEKWYNELFDAHQILKNCTNEENHINCLTKIFMIGEDCKVFDDYRSFCARNFNFILIDKIKNGIPFSDKNVQEIANAFKEILILDGFMQSARKFYTPQCGKGSQDNDLEPYLLLSKVISSAAKKEDKRNRRENVVEDQDDNGYYSWQLEHNEKELKKIAK